MVALNRISWIAAVVASLAVASLALSSCGNTIRGLGKDAANAVDATKDAGRRVGNAVK